MPATLEGVSLLKDGGISVRFHTNELSIKEKAEISNFYQQFGWVLFSPQQIDETDLELEQIRKDVGGKTPAQRLRAVLFIAYQQGGQIDKPFEQYYAEHMEKFINRVKAALKD